MELPRLGRLIKILILAAFGFGLLIAMFVGVIFIISGGHPVDFIQTEITRFTMRSRQDDLNRPVGSDNSPIRFTVNLGDSPRVIGENLLSASLISDSDLFLDYVRVSDLDVRLKAGTYFPNQTQTIPEIALMLTDSSKSFIPFRILEGWRIEEVAAAIDSNHLFGFTGADFLAAAGRGAPMDAGFAAAVGLPPGASAEGFLFPDTYQLPPEITPIGLRDLLTQAFLAQVGTQIPADAAAQGLSLYDIATLASIVQRESVNSDENPMIASAYRNRLDIGMKLDADPTVQYAIGFQNGTWWPQITQDDYTGVISDYNTYLNFDLPPGPIANPGLSAIRAAVYPETSDFLYFRAACDGSGYHNFSRTFEEHVANGC
jgi:UPF0755 protein